MKLAFFLPLLYCISMAKNKDSVSEFESKALPCYVANKPLAFTINQLLAAQDCYKSPTNEVNLEPGRVMDDVDSALIISNK